MLAAAAAGRAHEIRPAVVSVSFTDGARYTIEIATNVEAMLAGVSPQHRDTGESPNAKRYDALRALPPPALRRQIEQFMPRLMEGIRVEFDGRRVAPHSAAIDIPPVGDLGLSRLSRVRLEGVVPAGSRTFRWAYPAELGPSVLRLKRPQDREITAVWLSAGSSSEAFPLHGELAAKSRLEVAGEYLVLGFTHIVPKGLDHILFVLGLFLLSARLRPLLVQVTAFTVAHSLTLGLSIYGVFSLPPAIVEPLIAASVAYVAVENIFTSRLHAWRPVVVFGFGLLHGMGFAGVLQEIGLPRAESLTALVTFNTGVELGQLTVIGLAYVAVGRWSGNSAWYRARVVVPTSIAIAATGLYWTVARAMG